MYLPTSNAQLSDILDDLALYCRIEEIGEVGEFLQDARLALVMRAAKAPEQRLRPQPPKAR